MWKSCEGHGEPLKPLAELIDQGVAQVYRMAHRAAEQWQADFESLLGVLHDVSSVSDMLNKIGYKLNTDAELSIMSTLPHEAVFQKGSRVTVHYRADDTWYAATVDRWIDKTNKWLIIFDDSTYGEMQTREEHMWLLH